MNVGMDDRFVNMLVLVWLYHAGIHMFMLMMFVMNMRMTMGLSIFPSVCFLEFLECGAQRALLRRKWYSSIDLILEMSITCMVR